MLKTYAINLPRCRDRREHIRAECARFDLDLEIFQGIDGKTLTEAKLRGLLFDPDRNVLTPPEVGCALGHLGIYRDMIQKNIPCALILEDDIVFRINPRSLLNNLKHLSPDAPDVYLLTHGSNQYISGESRKFGDALFYRGWNGHGAYGYVITKAAAANIIRFQTPIKCVCDWWKYFQLHNLISFYIPDDEYVAPHKRLGGIATSLIEKERSACPESLKKEYCHSLRKQVPIHLRIKNILYKFKSLHRIRCQEIKGDVTEFAALNEFHGETIEAF